MKTMKQWCREANVSYWTAVKRREKMGLGTLIPPRTWLLSEKEWMKLWAEIERHRRGK